MGLGLGLPILSGITPNPSVATIPRASPLRQADAGGDRGRAGGARGGPRDEGPRRALIDSQVPPRSLVLSTREARDHSSGKPALRSPARYVASNKARTFGTPQYPWAVNWAML